MPLCAAVPHRAVQNQTTPLRVTPHQAAPLRAVALRWISLLAQAGSFVATGLLFSGCVSSSAPSAAHASAAEFATTAQGGRVKLSGAGNKPGAGNPAGIQLYAETAEGVFLLLADHTFPSARGWAGFGGAYDTGETIAETAARETEEETRGYFKRENLLAIITEQEPVFDGRFAFYFVKIDKVPVAEIDALSILGKGIAFAERGPYAWVPYSEVERALSASASTPASSSAAPATSPAGRGYVIDSAYLPANGRRTHWFWPVWLNNFRAAQAADAIPW